MDVSPQLLREVEFREQWRGYNPDEVDDFLERVAAALERLQEKLRETTDRAVRAERRVAEDSGDEALKRTLVLAQRTAQSAVDEAQAEAENLLAAARDQAATTLAEAEQRAAEMDAEVVARSAEAVENLARERVVLEADVVALQAWVELNQHDLAERLRQHLELLEGPGRLSLSTPPVLSERPEEPVEEPVAEDGGDGTPAVAQDGPVGAGSVEAVDGGDPTQAETYLPDGESGGPEVAEEPVEEEPVGVAERDAGTDGDPHTDTAGDTAAPTADGQPGTPAMGPDDDPFLTELRRAMDDPEPLGPRGDVSGSPADREDELTPAGRFRRRRRS